MLKLQVDASLQLTPFDDLPASVDTKTRTASLIDAAHLLKNGGATTIEQYIVTRWGGLGKEKALGCQLGAGFTVC